MSNRKDQNDPFGRGDRTTIRPNPGGRRPAAQPPAPPQQPYPPPAAYPPQGYPPQGAPPPGYPPGYAPPPPGYPAPLGYQTPPGQPPYYPPQPPAYPPPPGYPAAPAQGGEDWATPNPGAALPPPPPPMPTGPPRALVLKRDVPMARNQNLLMQTAGPMLLLLGRLRAGLMRGNAANLMEQMADAIGEFDTTIRGASVSEQHARTAKYILCATADDIVQNIPGDDRHVWTQYSMLSRFFGERTGGLRFFEELDKAKQDPTLNYSVLELMHSCLALGFQGVHRTQGGGAANLQQIQRVLYETLRRVRTRETSDISPTWQGQDIPLEGSTFRVPFWAVSSIAGVVAIGVYFTLRFLLASKAEAVADEISRLVPDTQVAIQRVAVAAPPPKPTPAARSTQLERIRAALGPEIEAQQITVTENANTIIIRVGSFASFASGQAAVLDRFKPIAAKLGDMLEKEQGPIRIVGHTDNVALSSTTRFASNFQLSVERANAVAVLIKAKLSQGDRVVTEGKGADQPLGSNSTREGQAQNRRVEILIQREK